MLTKLAGYDEYKLIQFYMLIFLRIQFSLVATFFFSSFDYLFELIFGSYTASRVLNIWRLKYKSI